MVRALAGILLPSIAIAAGGEGGHDAHGGAPSSDQWILLALTFVNFGIFLFLMRRFARNPLRDYLRVRRAEVIDRMAEAERIKVEAERLKAESERRATELDRAREDLIHEIRAIAEAERDRTLKEAEDAAARMRSDAERTAQSDLVRARQLLRAEAARLAEQIATGDIKGRMTDTDRRRLVDEFLERVGR